MAGLAFDGGAVGAVRERFRHMARAQTVRGEGFLSGPPRGSAFDDAIDGLVGEARGLDAGAADRTECGIVALMFEIGRLEPGQHGRDRACFWILARHDDDGSPLPF